MSLLIEGFERLELGLCPPGGSTSERPSDPLGWQFFSGDDANLGQLTIVDSSTSLGVDRGKGFQLQKVGARTGGFLLGANVMMPDNGWTKRLVGFHMYIDPTDVPGQYTSFVPFIRPSGTLWGSYPTYMSLAYRPTDGAMYLLNYSTSTAWTMPKGKRLHVEMTWDRASGQFQFYADSELKFTDTRDASRMNQFNNLLFTFLNANAIVGTVVIDDFYMLDDVGGDTVESLGPCKVDLALPVSTSPANFTPNTSVAGNYESVGDLPINPNTYVTASEVGARDVHAFSNPLVGMPSNTIVTAVQAQTIAVAEAARNLTIGLGVNGNFVTSAPAQVGADTTTIRTTMRRNPATGDFLTVNDLGALKSGYEIGTTFGE